VSESRRVDIAEREPSITVDEPTGRSAVATATATSGGVATLATEAPPAPVPAATGPDGGGPGGTATRPAPATPAAGRGWGLPLVVLIIGMFMSVLDTSIVNVAIPVIQKEFGVSASNAQWISTAYSLTEGVMVPISAWMGMRFGAKNLYIWSLLAFTVASALCGLSDNLGFMIGFRILQGIPGGMIPVTCLTMLYRMVPREKLGAAMGLYGLGVVVAPAIGPTLGGYFSEYFSWRLVYYVNVPVGILGAVAAMIVLAAVPAQKNRPLDVIGFLSIAGALFSVLLAFEEGPDWGWTGYRVLILFALAVNLFGVFVIRQLHVSVPLINLRIFARPQFTLSLVMISLFSVGLFAEFFYVPQFLQAVRGFSPMQAGLALMPQALMLVVLMPITGQLYDKIGSRWLAAIGMGLAGTGLLLLSDINVDMTLPRLTLGMVVMASGLGLGMMPVMTGGLATLPDDLSDSGGAFNTLVQRVSSALGLGILTAMVTANRAQFMADRSTLVHGGANGNPQINLMEQQGPKGLLPVWQHLSGMVQAQAYGTAFFVAGCLTLVGVVLAMFLPSGKPRGGGGAAVAH
jgi:EmrB/QacA subfamily drug resistance transporter